MQLDISDEVLESIRAAQQQAADGDVDRAKDAYQRLIDDLGPDDVQAAAVLHMYALIVDDPHEKLAINEDALARARRVTDGRFPDSLHASLLANLGYSHLELGDRDAARSWYEQAQDAAVGLDDDEYGRNVRAGIDFQLASIADVPPT